MTNIIGSSLNFLVSGRVNFIDRTRSYPQNEALLSSSVQVLGGYGKNTATLYVDSSPHGPTAKPEGNPTHSTLVLELTKDEIKALRKLLKRCLQEG